MSEIDIREEVTKIKIQDNNTPFLMCDYLIKSANSRNTIDFCCHEDVIEMGIKGKEHAENVIKAIQKAIELGWVK